MKKSLWSGFTAAVFTTLIVMTAPAVSLADTSTITINTQARAPKVRTAKIKIVLELASPPDPMTTTFNVDAGGPSGPTSLSMIGGATGNGDTFSLSQPSANSIQITYFPESRFAAAGNWCNVSGLLENQLITISYNGPHINGFRSSSYTVPKNAPGDDGTCAQAFRRIKDLAPLISVGNDSMPVAANNGRLPLDIILVLDKSGSMSGLASGISKYERLENAVGTFTGVWELADPDVSFGGSGVGDRLGLVYFDSTVTSFAGEAGTIFRVRSGPVGNGHNWQGIINDVVAKGPGGSTAMGSGLQTGINAFELNLNEFKNDATIVLMTDGMQNVSPLVTLAGTEWELDPDGGGPGLPKKLFQYAVPALTVYFGTPDATTTTLLDGIAQQMAGTSSIAGTAIEMDNSFSNQLVSALKGNTLSLLDRGEDTLPAGVSQSALRKFLVDGSVKRSVISLSWESTGRNPGLDLEIFPPGSTTKVTPVGTVNGQTWTVQGADIPAGATGDWQFRVVRKPFPGAPVNVASSIAIPYHFSIYSAEGKLDYQLTFPKINEGTGDEMVLAANVSYEGVPLTNLPANAIKLKIDRPPSAAGTVLHDPKNDVPDKVLTTEISPGDVTTPYDRKLAELERTGRLNGIRPQELADNFVLADNGQPASGDPHKDDGVYSARFADTSRPGLYRFKVTLDWDDPRTGKIHRSEVIERVVKVNSDPASSVVNVNHPGKGVVLINVTPKDKFGNFYGPSRRNPISVTVTGGGTVTGISDPRQSGDYVIRIEGVPAGSDPHVVISVDDRKITDDKVSNLPGGGTTPGGFRRWGLSLHAGVSIPQGSFNTVFNPGPNFGVDLEYRVNQTFSIEGIYTFHRFRGETFGPITVADLNVHQFSANGKVYGSSSPVRPFFNFGGGAYKFDPGNTHGGLNIGGGVQFDITPHIAFDAMYNFHNVFTSGSSTRFSTVQGGVRFRF